MIEWQCKDYSSLSKDDLYEILKIRQEVFCVEQNCVYQDVDNKDKTALHLFAWELSADNSKEIVAYLRIIYPKKHYKEPAIGRVLTAKKFRNKGLGKELISKAMNKINAEFPGQNIRISAQQYLFDFYSSFGFKTVSDPYLEDGIPHIEMLRKSKK